MEFSDSNVVLDYMVLVFLNNRFKKVCSFIYFDYVMALASGDFLKYFLEPNRIGFDLFYISILRFVRI